MRQKQYNEGSAQDVLKYHFDAGKGSSRWGGPLHRRAALLACLCLRATHHNLLDIDQLFYLGDVEQWAWDKKQWTLYEAWEKSSKLLAAAHERLLRFTGSEEDRQEAVTADLVRKLVGLVSQIDSAFAQDLGDDTTELADLLRAAAPWKSVFPLRLTEKGTS